jgi:hypothetical protein
MKLRNNKCIDCLYLGYKTSELTAGELTTTQRETIKSNSKNEGNVYSIRVKTFCVKEFYSKNELVEKTDIARCPKPIWKFYLQGWKPYKESINPFHAYEREKHNSLLAWTVIGVVIGTLVLIFTLIFGILNFRVN